MRVFLRFKTVRISLKYANNVPVLQLVPRSEVRHNSKSRVPGSLQWHFQYKIEESITIRCHFLPIPSFLSCDWLSGFQDRSFSFALGKCQHFERAFKSSAIRCVAELSPLSCAEEDELPLCVSWFYRHHDREENPGTCNPAEWPQSSGISTCRVRRRRSWQVLSDLPISSARIPKCLRSNRGRFLPTHRAISW